MKQTRDETYISLLEHSIEIGGHAKTFFAEYKAEKLHQWFGYHQYNTPGNLILDFGCADGIMTSFVHYLFNNAQVYGIDSSREHIASATNNYPTMEFKLCDTIISYPDNMFDLVYVSSVLHHVPRDQHNDIIKQLVRVTRPGGCIVIMELNPLNPLAAIRFMRNPLEHDARMMSPWYTRKLLRPYGTLSTKFFAFFQRSNVLRSYESWLEKLPCGSMYAIICTVSKVPHQP